MLVNFLLYECCVKRLDYLRFKWTAWLWHVWQFCTAWLQLTFSINCSFACFMVLYSLCLMQLALLWSGCILVCYLYSWTQQPVIYVLLIQMRKANEDMLSPHNSDNICKLTSHNLFCNDSELLWYTTEKQIPRFFPMLKFFRNVYYWVALCFLV